MGNTPANANARAPLAAPSLPLSPSLSLSAAAEHTSDAARDLLVSVAPKEETLVGQHL